MLTCAAAAGISAAVQTLKLVDIAAESAWTLAKL
jgi:hypothetical protein